MKIIFKLLKKFVKKRWKAFTLAAALIIATVSSIAIVSAAGESFTFTYNSDGINDNGFEYSTGDTISAVGHIVGESFQVKVTVLQDSTTLDPGNITWSSSNTGVCTISATTSDTTYSYTTLTLVSPGEVTITAEWNDGTNSYSSDFTLDVDFTISANQDNPIDADLYDTALLYINGLSSTVTPTWSIENSDVASITYSSGEGLISNFHAGITNATASIGSYEHDYEIWIRAIFDTTEAQTNGYYLSGVYTLEQGTSHVIETNVLDYSFVNFYTSDSSIVSIDNTTTNGNMTANSVGTARIYVSLNENLDGDTLTIDNFDEDYGDYIDVVVPLEITNGDMVLGVGDTAIVETNASDSSSVTWSLVSGSGVITVDSSGNVVAKSSGTAVVKASYTDADYNVYTDTITISVYNAFSLDQSAVTMDVSSTADILAILSDNDYEDYYTITVTSSDSTIATAAHVSGGDWGEYQITSGTATGTATLTFTLTSNGSGVSDGTVRTATCVVYVNAGVTSMSIDPESLTLVGGESGYVQALLYSDGTQLSTGTVSWYSLNESIASVESLSDRTANVTAGSTSGTTQIVAMSENGTYAYMTVYVATEITSVTLTDDSFIVYCQTQTDGTKLFDSSTGTGVFTPGNTSTGGTASTYQMLYTIGPEDASTDGYSISWSSSDTSIATVDEDGLVTFVGSGDVIISLTINNITDVCTIHVNEEVTDITLSDSEIELAVDETYELTSTITPSDAYNQDVTWYSSDESIATVDEDGVVTAVASGNAIITVKSDDGDYKANCIVTVYQSVTSIELSETEAEYKKGYVFYLYATVLPEDATKTDVTWTSSDESVATVNEYGRVDCVEAGECEITATSDDTGVSATCVLTVTQSITGVSLNYTSNSIDKDESFVLIPTITPDDAENKDVAWTTSDSSVATVDDNGIVTGVAGGTAIIICTTDDRGLIASCTVTVNEYVESVDITDSLSTMNVGENKQLSTSVLPTTASNQTLSWSSSNSAVISVDSKGKITANSTGSATITATASDGSGEYDSITITVIRPVTSITMSPKSIQLYEGEEASITATVSPSSASNQSLTWTSSDTSVARVDQNGGVYALSAGIATITATSNDGNGAYAESYITVKALVEASRVVINSSDITMLVGQQRTLSAKIYPTNTNESVTWYSTDTSVATVSSSGVITSKSAGQADIYAVSSYGTVEDSCTVTVIGLNATVITLEQYDSFVLDVFGATETVTWYTNNNRVATVDTNGNVVGRMAGTTTITASVNGKILYCIVNVTTMNPIN